MEDTPIQPRRIAAIMPKPPEHTEVLVPVLHAYDKAADHFIDEYLPEASWTGKMTRDEAVVLAGAFLTLIDHLGVRTHNLLPWMQHSGWGDDIYMREYAEMNLGMVPVEAPDDLPVRKGRRKAA